MAEEGAEAMDKGKKSNSLLYDLYMKCKEMMQKDEETEEVASIPDQVSEEKQSVVSDKNSETENETKVEVSDESMDALYSLYLSNRGEDHGQSEALDSSAFAERVLSSVTACPFYSQYEDEIRNFMKELGREAARKEQLHQRENSEYLQQKTRYETAAKDAMITKNAVATLKASNVSGLELDQALLREKIAVERFQKLSAPEELKAEDAAISARITKDGLHAFLFLFPPYRGGAKADRNRILSGLKEMSITYGVKEEQIAQIVSQRGYMKLWHIAEGISPVHGKDGEVIDKVSRSNEIAIQQGENGKADYKNLNLIQNVEAGDVLCEIIEAEKGIPGKNVSGSLIQARDGQSPKIPNGKNTVLSSDGKQLLAAEDGCVKFRNGCFHVEQVYVVKGNVDYGEGNIDVSGDVVVYGDVLNGFCVKAKGNITIQGMVEDAEIIAGGDIEIVKGMNGNRHGQLDAGGMVKAGFLENCMVYAGGSIHTNSIISCDIFCEDSVYVEGSRGVIIGGTITAFRSIEARIIGSKSNRETAIVLGEIPRMVTKRQEAQDELKSVNSTLEKLSKNVTYLERLIVTLPPEKLEILNQLKQQQDLYGDRKKELLEILDRLNNTTLDFDQCVVKANMIFPPTKIQIGIDNYVVTAVSSKCRVFKGEEGVTVGIL